MCKKSYIIQAPYVTNKSQTNKMAIKDIKLAGQISF